MTLVDLVERKFALAVALAHGHVPGADYTDANLVVAALLSGIAADLWPGRGMDRDRFLELWARESDPIFSPNLISVPFLYRDLRARAAADPVNPDLVAAEAASALSESLPGLLDAETRVLAGHEVDMAEGDVARLCPALSLKEIRDFSYPSVYYDQVRCATSHEYDLGTEATAHPMRLDADVSYSNRIVHGRSKRLIYFDLLWLWRVARSIAVRVGPGADWGRSRPKPPVWWSAGG